MTTTYEQVLGGQVNLAAVNFDGHSPAIRSLGRQFVMGCLTRGITPNNINQIMHELHNFLVRQGWVWNPEIPGNIFGGW